MNELERLKQVLKDLRTHLATRHHLFYRDVQELKELEERIAELEVRDVAGT